LDRLVQQGKVRQIGASNMPAWEVVDAVWTARHAGLTAFATCQDEYSLLERRAESELIPAMRKFGLGLLPYFPLASGLLSGKYRRDQPPPSGTRMAEWKRLGDRYLTDKNWHIIERLEKFCRARNRTMLELAISWLAARPVVSSIIAGATRPEQVAENVRAAELVLSAEDVAEVDRLSRHP
jgi:aryl-alcohol dehydrogenase-like predicted oxidoreductase